MNFKRFCSQKLHKQLEKLSSHLFQNMKKEFKRCITTPSLCSCLYMRGFSASSVRVLQGFGLCVESSPVSLCNRFIPHLRRIRLSHMNFLHTGRIRLSHTNFLHAGSLNRALSCEFPPRGGSLKSALSCEFPPNGLSQRRSDTTDTERGKIHREHIGGKIHREHIRS